MGTFLSSRQGDIFIELRHRPSNLWGRLRLIFILNLFHRDGQERQRGDCEV